MEGSDRLQQARALREHPPGNPNHDWVTYFPTQHNSMPIFPASAGVNYMTNGHQAQYSPYTTTYPSYSYLPSSSSSQTAVHWPSSTSTSMQYSVRPPPRSATLPSQPRILSRGYFSPSTQSQYSSHLHARTSMAFDIGLLDTEEQDSVNRDTMYSEPIEPPLSGYPKVEDFDDLMKSYVAQLSPKKQDKALIHARRASNIKTVLLDKKTTAVESAQFRFWVKKMFQLQPTDPSVPHARRKICHENKPVAIREKLFKILTRAHQKCSHGGRDKTSAQVRRVYSWVPKELISRFVKICPTCQIRRGLNRSSPEEQNSPPEIDDDGADEMESPIKRRRQSAANNRESEMVDMPMQLAHGSPVFQSQNRWLSDFHPPQPVYENMYSPTSATATSSFSTVNSMNAYGPTSSSQSTMPLTAINNVSPTSSRPASSHRSRYKQAEYCYN